MVTYADKPWLKFYEKGVPSSLDYPEQSLAQFLIDTAKRLPNKAALVTSAELPVLGRLANQTSYAELDRAAHRFGSSRLCDAT